MKKSLRHAAIAEPSRRRDPFLCLTLAMLFPLPSCAASQPRDCRELTSVLKGDPIRDARAAFIAGDRRLLSLGGFVGTTPGVNGNPLSARQLPGTGDMKNPACSAYHREALFYAERYNKVIASLLGQARRETH